MSTCAACGKGGDGLKACTGCGQVKYCNGACRNRKAHFQKHKKQCRKNAAKKKENYDDDTMTMVDIDALSEEMNRIVISDDELLKEPPPRDDCPICFLPMPHSNGVCGVHCVYQPCCGKKLCAGCVIVANVEMENGNMKRCCPFCREPLHIEKFIERCKKRMEVNDAKAICIVGDAYKQGGRGVPLNKKKSFELYLQAAKLGSYEAHFQIANAYRHGEDYVKKDMKRAAHHYKLAAMGGDEIARYNFAIIEECECMNRAMRHFLILARIGCDDSLKMVGKGYKEGYVTKDEYANTLRAHKDSKDEIESEERTKAHHLYLASKAREHER